MKYSIPVSANSKHVILGKNRLSSKSNVDLNEFVIHERSNDMTKLVYEKVVKLSKVSSLVKVVTL
ncbi:MAG: hypothetical protein ACTS4Z_00125 [Candidatus Hodgkinia cicadicola]